MVEKDNEQKAKKRLQWIIKEGKYGRNTTGQFGSWLIFTIEYNSFRFVSDVDNEYKMVCLLPGIQKVFYAAQVIGLMKKAETILEYWLKEAGML
jgi:hypothetical protein